MWLSECNYAVALVLWVFSHASIWLLRCFLGLIECYYAVAKVF